MKKPSEKHQRERKFMLFLPLLTLPFIFFAFWALGGGKGATADPDSTEEGLNMALPEARVEEGVMDKMESYREAERKESRLRDLRRMGPFSEVSPVEETEKFPANANYGEESLTLEETENSVREKLLELEELIGNTGKENVFKPIYQESSPKDFLETEDRGSAELRRLESMMASIADQEREDPEMIRIEGMLDKLLDVQHPRRVQERMMQYMEDTGLKKFPVSISPGLGINSESADSERYDGLEKQNIGFYGLEKRKPEAFSEIKPAISVRVTSDQVIVDGASIELELDQTVFIKGERLQKGSLLSGICSLNGERLLINVSAIRSGNLIIPVNLNAVDLDALPGIRIPDAITRSAVKQGSGDGVRSMNVMPLSNSWEAQASMAGMETVKGIFSRKAKITRITVKAGHPLLLKDDSGQ